MSNLSINNISEELKRDFYNVSSNGDTNAKTLELLIKHYNLIGCAFSDEEQSIIQKAIDVSPKASRRTIHNAILNAAKSINKSVESDNYNLEHKNSAIAADKRASNVLDLIFKHNDKAKEWFDRIFITPSSFMKFAQECKDAGTIKTVFNKYTVYRCMERSQSLIDEHHAKHKLEPNHNVKAHHHRRKLENTKDKK